MKRLILGMCTAAILLFACNNEKTANETATENTAASDSATNYYIA